MNRTLRIAVLTLALAAFAIANPGLADAASRGFGLGKDSVGRMADTDTHDYAHRIKYKHKHHGHGYGWWPWALPLAAAVTGALLYPFYSHNYYAPPAPRYYRRPCHLATVRELDYWRQPVLVTRTICYDAYGNAYIAR